MVGRRSQVVSEVSCLNSQAKNGSGSWIFLLLLCLPFIQCLVKCCQKMLTRNTCKIMIDFFRPLEQNPVQHHGFLFKMCGCSETVNAALKMHILCHQSNLCTAKSCVNLISQTMLEEHWNWCYSQDNISKCIFPMLNISLSFLLSNSVLMLITDKKYLF